MILSETLISSLIRLRISGWGWRRTAGLILERRAALLNDGLHLGRVGARLGGGRFLRGGLFRFGRYFRVLHGDRFRCLLVLPFFRLPAQRVGRPHGRHNGETGGDQPAGQPEDRRMNAKITHIRTIVPTGPMPRRRFLRIKPPPSRITLHSTWIRLFRQAQLYICSLEL